MPLPAFTRSGFMLRDLMASMVLTVLTLAMVLPGCSGKDEELKETEGGGIFVRMRRSQLRQSTNNNLRQLGIAVHVANGDFKKLPPAFAAYGATTEKTTLFVHMFPYLELQAAFVQRKWDIHVPVFHAPTDPTEAGQQTGTSFVANRAVFDDSTPVALGGRGGTGTTCYANLSSSMPDGTSNVILFTTGAIECVGVRAYNTLGTNFITNTQPQWKWDHQKLTCRSASPQPFDAAGIGVCMGDAVTRTVAPTCSAQSWTNAMKTNDGLNPGMDF